MTAASATAMASLLMTFFSSIPRGPASPLSAHAADPNPPLPHRDIDLWGRTLLHREISTRLMSARGQTRT